MNPERKTLSKRRLRLEQLENRALLAGGSFDFTVELGNRDHTERDHNTPRQLDQRQQLARGGSFDQRGGLGGDGQPQHVRQQRHSQHRHDIQDVKEFPSFAAPLSPSFNIQPPPRASVNDQPPSLLRSTEALTQSRQQPIASESSVTASVQFLDLTLAALANSDPLETEEPPFQDAELVVSFDRSAGMKSHDKVRYESESPVVIIAAEPQSLADSVELLPLKTWQPLDASSESSRSSSDLGPWQLDDLILPQLRETIENTANKLAERTDTVVQYEWSEAGGMVAIDRVQLAPVRFAPTDATVNVQIESTVMLYRSLNLFASIDATASEFALQRVAPVSSPLSDRALDSIMAAIGTLADSQNQPIGNLSPLQVHAIVYPLAVVAVSGAAISAKRKPKNQLLLHSQQQLCDEPIRSRLKDLLDDPGG